MALKYRRVKRRAKKNPSVGMVAGVLGVGVVGYLIYSHFRGKTASAAELPAGTPGSPATKPPTGILTTWNPFATATPAPPKVTYAFRPGAFGVQNCFDSTGKAADPAKCRANELAGLGGIFSKGTLR